MIVHAGSMSRPRHARLAGQRARELRNNQTVSEANLWASIRRRQLGVRFRRQVPIGPWIVDFACLDPKIVIEVDDSSHYWKDEQDRTEYIESQGFTILRLDNKEIALAHEDSIAWLQRFVDWIKRHRPPT
jgi:very-short-patch-repair endonuclease